MKRNLLALFLALALIATAFQAQAFDGDRKGFMLNLGVGAGSAKMTGSAGDFDASLDETGFGGDFKIGGGINPQTMIYYTNRTLFYSTEMTYYDPILETNHTASSDLINGMSAVGVSYFLEPQAPSFFFSGALGIGVLTDSEGDDSESGFGFTVGAGYEFAKNWIIEGTYMHAGIGEELGVDFSISNLMLSVSWLAY